MTNTSSLRRHSQAVGIDALGNLWFRFRSSASRLFSFFPLQLTWIKGKEDIHFGIYTKCTGCHCSNPRPVLKHSYKTWNQTNPGTTRVLGNRRDLIQAAELWTFIFIGVLCSPRAAPVLMCAASWTTVTQPWRLHIQSEADQWARLWKRK